MAINEYKYGGVLMTKPYYEKENAILIHADSFKLLEKIKPCLLYTSDAADE